MEKMRTMLYVDDVEETAQWWQDNLGATVVEVNVLPDESHNIVLTMAPGAELSFFSKAFIRQYSPEVLGSTPSLMFFVKDFEALHDRLTTAGAIADNNGMLTFNFRDPEGNYFAVGQVK
ncbi:VOC family protein [Levilactobacillus huananensis]|uniref:VOC family protein n=1 Tax=Levilactobacillus huananensis TaxID=2486019 RepID=UPI000F78457B|nr:VOC family protein [Levilactobacillus huananensis]